MGMIRKTIRRTVTAALLLLTLYTGISCVLTFRRAGLQPVLRSGTEEYHFLGYSMLGTAEGALCVLGCAGLIMLWYRSRKTRQKNDRTVKEIQ